MLKISQMVKVIEDSGLFDRSWYLAEYPDVALSGAEPVFHYVKIGRRLGRKPIRDFDPSAYLAANQDVARNGSDPFIHYIQYGRREGRRLRPQSQTEDLMQLIQGSRYFDRAWYVAQYGAKIGNQDPLMHYLHEGAKLGFDPGPEFSTTGYLDTYRDIKAAGINPLVHFTKSGHKEGRLPKPKPRRQDLGLRRFSPEESGKPHTILKFDAAAIPIAGIENERIAVHVHLYFSEMVDTIVDRLRNIRHPFTLLVSVQETEDPDFWRAYLRGKLPLATDIIVKTVPNHGRDVAPWLVSFGAEVRESTIFCHLHTKKSHHSSAHRGWFRYLCHTMLGSPGVVDGILEILCCDKEAGIVAPCYYWTLASQPNYGKNRSVMEKLYGRITDGNLPEFCPDYPAGSFFWARTKVLRPLLELDLSLDDFDPEAGQVDGTLAHGVERLLGLLPQLCGTNLRLVTVDVAYDLVHFVAKDRYRVPIQFVPRIARRTSPPSQSQPTAFYTSITGGYETVTEILRDPGDADLVFFSDDPDSEVPKGFSRRVPNYISPEPVRTARFVKLHPHVWFQHHDWAIWCDANIYFQGDLLEYIDVVRQSGADCGFIRHPVRDNVLDEANELIEKRIVKDRDAVERQMERYMREIPGILSSPLIETNFFVCRPKSPEVVQFFRTWWGELNRESHRDQLSVNYAIEKTGLKWVDILPAGRSARNADDFILFAHDVAHRQEIINMTKAGQHAA